MVLSLAVLLTVVGPIAGAIGTFVYDAHTQVYAEEAQTRHQVTATAIEDGTVVVQPRAFRSQPGPPGVRQDVITPKSSHGQIR